MPFMLYTSEVEVKSEWNRSRILLKPKWSRSEVEVKSKWSRSAVEVKSFWKTTSDTFDQKPHFFDHPNGLTHKRGCHCCLLLLLCCPFGSLCVRFLPPSKTACSSTPVLFSPPSPFCKNDGMHSTCNFMNFVCSLLLSLCISCFTHPFLHLVCRVSLKMCFPPSLGSMIFKNACM